MVPPRPHETGLLGDQRLDLDDLRLQRGQQNKSENLSATELSHTYTQPEDYIRWAKEYMSVEE